MIPPGSWNCVCKGLGNEEGQTASLGIKKEQLHRKQISTAGGGFADMALSLSPFHPLQGSESPDAPQEILVGQLSNHGEIHTF